MALDKAADEGHIIQGCPGPGSGQSINLDYKRLKLKFLLLLVH